MISTGYDLPFETRLIGLARSARQRVVVRVLLQSDDPQRTARAAGCLVRFASLAGTGALGGRGVAPWESDWTFEARPTAHPGELRVEATTRLSQEAWVVLAHLLAAQVDPGGIKGLVIAAQAVEPVVETLVRSPQGFSTYPRRYSPLPFALDDQNPEGGTLNFYLRLESPMTPPHEALLNRQLHTWIDAVRHGGYALAPLDARTDYVEPHSDTVDCYENVVEWTFYKLRADPVAALHGIVNLLARFHHHGQGIASVEIA